MIIGLTMGDPNGIGPELILRAFQDGDLSGEPVVIGDFELLRHARALLRLDLPLRRLSSPSDYAAGALNVLDQSLFAPPQLRPGELAKEAGAAGRQYVVIATQLALRGEIGAIVTLPLNKEATRLSDPGFTGHTELIAGLCAAPDCAMMLATEQIMVSHVSTHVPLARAIALVTTERVARVIALTHECLHRFLPEPRLAVAGLNPHAGEHGAFGDEETQAIEPAIVMAQRQGIGVAGPFPPDTVFLQASRGKYDAVVAMYHDQGHIPAKILDFEGGVNITLGLPIIRTSVDHGTAFDLAYCGLASTRSLAAAYRWALKLTSLNGGSL